MADDVRHHHASAGLAGVGYGVKAAWLSQSGPPAVAGPLQAGRTGPPPRGKLAISAEHLRGGPDRLHPGRYLSGVAEHRHGLSPAARLFPHHRVLRWLHDFLRLRLRDGVSPAPARRTMGPRERGCQRATGVAAVWLGWKAVELLSR